jgi:formylmethanofuran dehydrogenase subunit E
MDNNQHQMPTVGPQPHTDVIYQQMEESAVVVNLKSEGMYELNSTAARLWELLVAGNRPEQIKQQMLQEYDLDEAQLTLEIDAFMARLVNEGLVKVDDDK